MNRFVSKRLDLTAWHDWRARLVRPGSAWLGPALAALAVGVAGVFVCGGAAGKLLALALLGLGLVAAAFHYPVVLALALLAAAPFNFGFMTGGASIKLSEGIGAAMLGIILLRLVAGDVQAFRRLRRAAFPLAMLAMLGVFAVLTAAPHPNVFNVRYELWTLAAGAYAILFFRRSWWPALLAAILAVLLTESVAALVLKFVLGLTGTNFFNVGGVGVIQFSAEDLANLAGGSFRLSGTMGHKNMLAAFYVLLMPVVALEILHRARLHWRWCYCPAW
jgi:hypothetical protein